MKRFRIMTLALLAMLALTSISAGQSLDPLRKGDISVTGEAEIKVVPDKAVIALGVETLDSSMVEAKKQNDKMVDSIMAAALKQGVSKSDIQTDYLDVEPRFERRRDKNGREYDHFIGHNVRRQLVITLNDIARFDDLLSAVIDAGVSRVIDVGFYTNDLKKYREQARTLAIKAAAEKAEKLTAEIGQSVGKATHIREGGSYWGSYYGDWDSYGRRGRRYSSQVSVDAEPQGGDSPPAVGKISVTASVTVSFELN